MALTYHSTGARFCIPGEGPDGSDGTEPSLARNLEAATNDIKSALVAEDRILDRIEVLPLAGTRQLLAVYCEDAADRNIDPVFLVLNQD